MGKTIVKMERVLFNKNNIKDHKIMNVEIKIGDIIRFKDEVYLYEVVEDNNEYKLREINNTCSKNNYLSIGLLFDYSFEVIKDIKDVKCAEICCSTCPLYKFSNSCTGVDVKDTLLDKLIGIKKNAQREYHEASVLEQKWMGNK